jgi:hypothetical protein
MSHPKKAHLYWTLELDLGTISQVASAATRVHIWTTPTPAIEFEDEVEFEEDFLYLLRGQPFRDS